MAQRSAFTFRQSLVPYLVLAAVMAALTAHAVSTRRLSIAPLVLAYLVYACIRTGFTKYTVTRSEFIRERPWGTLRVPLSEVDAVEKRRNLYRNDLVISTRMTGPGRVVRIAFVEDADGVVDAFRERGVEARV